MKHIAYFRVSTVQQGQSGLGLDAQRLAVNNYITSSGAELIAEYTEIESGRRAANRPQLLAALDACKRHKAILVIAKLDRLARNVHFISGIMESSVDFIALDNPTANRLMMHMLAAFAEHEREMISKRTKEALAIAKARGVKIGNPRAAETAPIAHAAWRKIAADFAAPLIPMVLEMKAKGMNLTAMAKEMNDRKIPTPRGGKWYMQTVKRLLERA